MFLAMFYKSKDVFQHIQKSITCRFLTGCKSSTCNAMLVYYHSQHHLAILCYSKQISLFLFGSLVSNGTPSVLGRFSCKNHQTFCYSQWFGFKNNCSLPISICICMVGCSPDMFKPASLPQPTDMPQVCLTKMVRKTPHCSVSH